MTNEQHQPIIIKTDDFEGPLELLIELIKKRKMDINNLSISTLTKDFLDNIGHLKTQKIEVTSDFMEMASLLLQIKTEMLLPQEGQKDPRGILIKEIEAYESYKSSIERFQELEQIERKFLKRTKRDKVKKERKGTLSDLFKSYEAVLQKKRFQERNSRLDELSKKLNESKFTVEDRIEHLRSFKEPITVESFFSEMDDLEEMIVTFSAILELVHRQHFSIYFSDEDNRLLIRLKGVEK